MTSSSLSLAASPATGEVNEPVTLYATVGSADGRSTPQSWASFADGDATIPGCAAQPVVSDGGSQGTATCTTSLPAGTAPLSSAFIPAPGSPVAASSSATLSWTVSRAATALSVTATARPVAESRTTLTATLVLPPAAAGVLLPTGSVRFLDGGRSLAGCQAQAVSRGRASCVVTFSGAGAHAVTARYGGDANFDPAPAAAAAVDVGPAPVRGFLGATLRWTFFYTPAYTRVLGLVLNGAAAGSTVTIGCRGPGCPFSQRHETVAEASRCAAAGTGTCMPPGRIDLTGAFGAGHLGAGAHITLMVVRPFYVGKYYSFTVRAGGRPQVSIACLAPGSTRPGVGCRSAA